MVTRTFLGGICAIIIACCSMAAQAQLPTAASQEPEVRELLVVEHWANDGVTRLRLESAEDNSGVQKVDLDIGCQSQGWMVSLRGETPADSDALSLGVKTRAELNDKLRTFVEWNQHGDTNKLRGGVEASVFGRDRWKAARTVELSDTATELPVTETSLGLALSDATSVNIGGKHSQLQAEVQGGFTCRVADGIDLGATLKARRLDPSEEINWRRPAWEGHLRWSW